MVSIFKNNNSTKDKILNWKEVKCTGLGTRTRAAKVPGGWLVAIENMSGLGLSFYPDPNHEWDGVSLK
jgi:hypothetical protein